MTVYFVTRNDDPRRLIKIGHAVDLRARLSALGVATPEGLTLLASIEGGVDVEKGLHAQFSHLHVAGEWFSPGPDLLAAIDRALSGGDPCTAETRTTIRVSGRAVPKIEDITANSSAVEFAIACLNELTTREYRGQGDTMTAARDRVAETVGVQRTLVKRLWDRWRTMDDCSGGMMLALAECLAIKRVDEGNCPHQLALYHPERRKRPDPRTLNQQALPSRADVARPRKRFSERRDGE